MCQALTENFEFPWWYHNNNAETCTSYVLPTVLCTVQTILKPEIAFSFPVVETDFSLYPKIPDQFLGPTQIPIQLVQGTFSQE